MSEPLRMTVIGTGYLGATHAAAMAESGYEVLGVDVDKAKVEALARGEVPFFEPGLAELLRTNVAAGRLRFTTDYAEAAEFGDLHFLGVGTPQHPRTNAADLSQVHGAIDTLAPLLRRPCTVVGKSTVPVGTAAALRDRLHALAPAGDQVDLVWNPEFLREGFAVADTLTPDRIVIGLAEQAAPGEPPTRDEAIMRRVYAPMIAWGSPFLVMDYPTSELVKVAANSFLATKISFINAMAEVCEATGADVKALAEALGHDERIGPKFLRAGIGFGGGCLPKDIRAFMARAGELGVADALSFLRDVDGINTRRRASTVALARELVGGRFVGRRIAVLGAAFKPDSDDVRDSPALDIAAAIYTAGGDVVVHDPQALANAQAAYPTMAYAGDVREALTDADLVLLLTEWRDYTELDPFDIVHLPANPHVLDGRNALDAGRWRGAGWQYRGLGRPNA
ncbi:MAG TPA: UDP-glucose/GDP-mannose dehydrogenase family protein [Candidatus Nanopelagicales bacterium]